MSWTARSVVRSVEDMSTAHPTSHRPHVLVSGASVAGLTTAHWLARYGFAVTVVERAPHLRPGGHALDVRGPALEVAARMGVLAALRERSTQLTGMAVVDDAGHEVFRSTEGTFTGGRLDRPDVEILRDDLCRVLHAAVDGAVEYLFDDSIATLVQDPAGVDVGFVTAAPRRFDLVIGADGLHSRVRRLVFGVEERFVRRVGDAYIATFGLPNFLGLERWQVFYQHPNAAALLVGLTKNAPARAYLGFSAPQPLAYDFRDLDAQKNLVADRVAGAGWVVPQLVEHMLRAPDFHFDAMSQVRMDRWSRGRVVLVGDAGYSISPASGQGTTVAMVGAYVLAGELAAHEDLARGAAAYESALREYVLRSQEAALAADAAVPEGGGRSGQAETSGAGGLPDFGALVEPFELEAYAER